MISPDHLLKMLAVKALSNFREIDDNLLFDVNFFIVYTQFPQYLEELVLFNLNPFEREVYKQGYMYYTILPNGRLLWKPTAKRFEY